MDYKTRTTPDLKSRGETPTTAGSGIVTKPPSTLEAYAARTAIFSGVLFAVLLLSLHVLEPEFDPTWRFVSEYMLGDFGWLMHLAFLTLAVSMASAGVDGFIPSPHLDWVPRPYCSGDCRRRYPHRRHLHDRPGHHEPESSGCDVQRHHARVRGLARLHARGSPVAEFQLGA